MPRANTVPLQASPRPRRGQPPVASPDAHAWVNDLDEIGDRHRERLCADFRRVLRATTQDAVQ